MPPVRRHDRGVDLSRSPGPSLIFIHRSGPLQDRIDNPPAFFDVIIAGKVTRVARHRIAENVFIRLHLFRAGMTASHHCVVFDVSPNAVADLVREKATGATNLKDFGQRWHPRERYGP